MLIPTFCVPFDRRLPAMFYGDLVVIPNNRDDIFRAAYYIGEVWQVIRYRVTGDRADVGLHMVKRLYQFSCGAGVVS